MAEGRLSLIDEILQDLAEKDILYSTDGTEMDDEGHADVTMAPPEDVQRNQLEQVPLPSQTKVSKMRYELHSSG